MSLRKFAMVATLVVAFSSNVSRADEWDDLMAAFNLSEQQLAGIIAEMGGNPTAEEVGQFITIGSAPVEGPPLKPLPGPREEIESGIQAIQQKQDEDMKKLSDLVSTTLPPAGMVGDAVKGDYGGVTCRMVSGCSPITTIKGVCIKVLTAICDRWVDPGE